MNTTRSQLLLTAIIGALTNADALAAQYQAETGVKLGPFYDASDFQPATGGEPREAPIWDANGVSQPIGPYGLVMLKAVEDKRAEIAAVSPKHAEGLAHLYACLPGLAKLDARSDNWWIVFTEISWASFGAFQTNPFEAQCVNVYDRVPGDPSLQLPSERLQRRYQEYVPDALALPRELTSATACAARVLEQVRLKMDNDRIPDTDAIDFSPARPRGFRG